MNASARRSAAVRSWLWRSDSAVSRRGRAICKCADTRAEAAHREALAKATFGLAEPENHFVEGDGLQMVPVSTP
jgi:hypothetical protein